MTQYLVQTGKGTKGSYTTRYNFCNEVAAFGLARTYYAGINTANGFKKRLVKVDETGKRTTLAKYQS